MDEDSGGGSYDFDQTSRNAINLLNMAAVMKVSLSRLSTPLVRQRKIVRKEGRMEGA